MADEPIEPLHSDSRATTYILTPAYESEAYDPRNEFTVEDCLVVLLKRRWLILGIWLLVIAVAMAASYLEQPRYQAQATFLVAEKSSENILGEGNSGDFEFKDPVAYYREIAVSSPILNRLLKEPFGLRDGDEKIPLIDLLNVTGYTEEERLYRGRELLKRDIDVVSQKNFVYLLTLTAEASTPELAAALANRLIDLLRSYDIELKTANVQNRMQFLESQLAETEKNLRSTEKEFEYFQKRNRMTNAPHLMLERDRLERDLSLQDDLYRTFRRELELARIAEKKDASAISLIDSAVPPRIPSSPKTGRAVAIASAAGLLLGVLLAFVLEFASRLGAARGEGSELIQAWQATKNDFRKLAFLGVRKQLPDRNPASRKSAEY